MAGPQRRADDTGNYFAADWRERSAACARTMFAAEMEIPGVLFFSGRLSFSVQKCFCKESNGARVKCWDREAGGAGNLVWCAAGGREEHARREGMPRGLGRRTRGDFDKARRTVCCERAMVRRETRRRFEMGRTLAFLADAFSGGAAGAFRCFAKGRKNFQIFISTRLT